MFHRAFTRDTARHHKDARAHHLCMVLIEHPSEGGVQVDSIRRLWIAGCALLVVGVVASAVGQESRSH